MLSSFQWSVVLHFLLQALTLMRVLAREDREPAARMAWVLVVVGLPFVGVGLYFLVGEVRISRGKIQRMTEALAALPPEPPSAPGEAPIPEPYRPAFARAAAANGFRPLPGNRIAMMRDSDSFIDRLVEDIDVAQRHCHLLFYIWLNDRNGERVAEALIRAAGRGVTCRVMVDALGARKFAGSATWGRMRAAGVQCTRAFAISFPRLRLSISRIDIRNHRKIVVIDNHIAYAGSQNCADPAFAIKPRFAPWVDIMVRMTGPVVWQHQQLFAADWATHAYETIDELLAEPMHDADGGPEGRVTAIAVGSGPGMNKKAVSDLFQAVIATAQRDLLIVTPYYVPNEALHQQICAAAVRGVRVRMILPERNDSRTVGLASRSYYRPLISAGVELYEYRPGLLHAKVLVADMQGIVVGSANMDRRSFELNYENSLLAHDVALAAALRVRFEEWLDDSQRVDPELIRAWGLPRRMACNLVATVGPLL
ncbi:cardiolipin synthase [Frigidibacter sp. MR17.14]|uniref:cardiolipin synthase n=1 Tax=Frigidibacter sp. MR17.14 TaxID=3126509 RepID=UPI0030130C26